MDTRPDNKQPTTHQILEQPLRVCQVLSVRKVEAKVFEHVLQVGLHAVTLVVVKQAASNIPLLPRLARVCCLARGRGCSRQGGQLLMSQSIEQESCCRSEVCSAAQASSLPSALAEAGLAKQT